MGLKSSIIGILAVLLFGATVLTFFVVSVFWLRASALALAQEKQTMFVFVAQHVADRPELFLGAQGDFFPVLAEEALAATGAVSFCVQSGTAKAHCQGAVQYGHNGLESLFARPLVQADAQINAQHVLHGLLWVGSVPAPLFLDLVVFMRAPNGVPGAVALRYPLEPHYAGILAVQHSLAGYLLINCLVLLLVGFFKFRQKIMRPLENLIWRTDSYSDASGLPFLTLHGGDELAQLSASMQRMLGRIRADQEKLQGHVATLEQVNQQLIASRAEVIRAEKFSSLGRLAAGLAHEIGNPVGIVQGYLDLIAQPDVTNVDRTEFCHRSERELQRIAQLVRQMLDLARPSLEIKEQVDVHQVVNEALVLLRPQPLMDGIVLRTHLLAQNFLVYGCAAHILQVLLNCLMNAADALFSRTKKDAWIEIVTEPCLHEAKQALRIVVKDSGVGFAPDVMENAFDPFFTTKEPGKGTGLGLSVSYALLTAMGGRLHLANHAEGGAEVSITLPLIAS